MAANIKITTEMVRALGESFTSSFRQTEERNTRLSQLVADLDTRWEGLANTDFNGRFVQWSQEMKAIEELLTSIGSTLKEISERFEDADQPW